METTTQYFDIPTGQVYAAWVFPGCASGIIYRLDITFEREPPPASQGRVEPVAPIGAVGIIEDPPDARPNQGQTKLEDVPGRYRLEFSPSDPDQEDIVTVYECDPSSGESTVPNPVPPQAVRPLRAPVPHRPENPVTSCSQGSITGP